MKVKAAKMSAGSELKAVKVQAAKMQTAEVKAEKMSADSELKTAKMSAGNESEGGENECRQ